MELVAEQDLAPGMTEFDITDRLEDIRLTYGRRMLNLLGKISTELNQFKWFTSRPRNMGNHEFAIIISRDEDRIARDEPSDGDLQLYTCVMDSRAWGASVRGGVAFKVDVSSFAGELVGGYMPVDYTSSIWVPVFDIAAIELQMAKIEVLEPYTLVKLLEKWQKGKSR